MFISRIELQNWKNFRKASSDLALRTFVIGPNASGKSNLIDAFRFLRDVARDGLSKSVEVRGGLSAIRCLAARQSPSVTLRIVISASPGRPVWSYKLEFNQDASRTPKVRSEVVEDLTNDVRILSRPRPEDTADPERLTQTWLEQISTNRDFRDVAYFFSTFSYQHLVPQVVRDPREFSATPVKNDPYGRDLILRAWNTPQTTRTAWLKRITSVLRSAVPQLQSLDVEMDSSKGVPHLVGRYEHWRAYGAKQNEAQFSDGTLRLFGLMWAMFEGAGPLLLEEPELSLHPEVVRLIPQLLEQLQVEIHRMKRKKGVARRQLLVSTHSEEMLSDLSISAEEVLRIVPSSEGSIFAETSEDERAALMQGLSVADVLLPKTAPETFQLSFDFSR